MFYNQCNHLAAAGCACFYFNKQWPFPNKFAISAQVPTCQCGIYKMFHPQDILTLLLQLAWVIINCKNVVKKKKRDCINNKKKERKVCYSWDDSQLKPSLPGAISVSSSIGLHHLIGVLCCDRGPREELMNLWIIKMTKKRGWRCGIWSSVWKSCPVCLETDANLCFTVPPCVSVCVHDSSWPLLQSDDELCNY